MTGFSLSLTLAVTSFSSDTAALLLSGCCLLLIDDLGFVDHP